MKTLYFSLLIITVLLSALACRPHSPVDQPAANTLTKEAFLKTFAAQPDHQADRIINLNGSTIQINFAKKGKQTRQEFYPLAQATNLKNAADKNYRLITLEQENQPAISFDPQAKTYTELPEHFSLAPFDIEHFLDTANTELGKLKIEDTGTETVDNHEARKIRLTFEGEEGEVSFYFAKDLQNLFIKMDSKGIEEMNGTYTLANISFSVPDELFTLPQGYKKVDFNTFITSMRDKMKP
jgi:hypothetical protein